MFKIYDGRSQFYQWDLDRKLIVEDESINQVHFCNRTDECSLVCEVYNEGDLRVVDVPNILLQTDWRINVYGYDAVYTKHSERFDVVARTKPADYVYTETEVLNYNTLLERMNDIEGAIGETVKEYLEENPIEVDLTGYATEEYVQEAIAGIPETDLSDYATIKDVQDAVDGIEIPTVDLSDYAKRDELPSVEGLASEQYVDEAIANLDIPTPEASVEEVHVGAEAPTDPNVKLWVDTDEEAPGVDVDLSNYYTKQEVDSAIGAIEHPQPDLSGYALKSEIPDVSNYQTAEQVTAAINEALGVVENGTY